MNARTIMRVDPFTVAATDTLGDAHELMLRHGIRHLPVVHQGHVVGMLSERDVFEASELHDGRTPWWRRLVGATMTTPAQTVRPEDSLAAISARLEAANIDVLPVVDRGKLVGLVTVADVLEAERMTAVTWQ